MWQSLELEMVFCAGISGNARPQNRNVEKLREDSRTAMTPKLPRKNRL